MSFPVTVIVGCSSSGLAIPEVGESYVKQMFFTLI